MTAMISSVPSVAGAILAFSLQDVKETSSKIESKWTKIERNRGEMEQHRTARPTREGNKESNIESK